MCRLQVPFGYIPAVRDWLKLSGNVEKPEKELPSRPVTGLNCDKIEQSGQRFWSLLQTLCGDDPNGFFDQCFIYNYCPLAFFHSSGRNITPAEIKVNDKSYLYRSQNRFRTRVIVILAADWIEESHHRHLSTHPGRGHPLHCTENHRISWPLHGTLCQRIAQKPQHQRDHSAFVHAASESTQFEQHQLER